MTTCHWFALRVCVNHQVHQVLLWHSVIGQSKTPGSFVGPLSELTVSDESEVELAKWLVSKTLTGLVNLLDFAM